MTYKPFAKQSGFTIVELMIAITVLSIVLLICSLGISRIGQIFYKGIITSSTQQASRSINDDITRAIQFSGGTVSAPVLPGDVQVFCAGDQRFAYVINAKASTTTDYPNNLAQHVLWRDTSTTCDLAGLNMLATTPSANGVDMVGSNLRLTKLSVTPVAGTTLYDVKVVVMYGDDDLIDKTASDKANWFCKPSGGLVAASFCARSEQATVVSKRLR